MNRAVDSELGKVCRVLLPGKLSVSPCLGKEPDFLFRTQRIETRIELSPLADPGTSFPDAIGSPEEKVDDNKNATKARWEIRRHLKRLQWCRFITFVGASNPLNEDDNDRQFYCSSSFCHSFVLPGETQKDIVPRFGIYSELPLTGLTTDSGFFRDSSDDTVQSDSR